MSICTLLSFYFIFSITNTQFIHLSNGFPCTRGGFCMLPLPLPFTRVVAAAHWLSAIICVGCLCHHHTYNGFEKGNNSRPECLPEKRAI